ncbi:MAG: VOC family protein [Anaerolineae bacterium]|nr:VOC family protein [Anaerolineae bacterium]
MAVTAIGEKVLTQVCLVVRDAEAMAARYAEIFGFETAWDFQITRLHDHTQATDYGKPTDARARITGFQMGSVAFELLQPLDSPSVWMDHLAQHGEGIHHVAFSVPRTALHCAA